MLPPDAGELRSRCRRGAEPQRGRNGLTIVLRRLRALILLMVLVAVATGTWLDRIQSTDWDGPLLVSLYPVNADGSAAAASEIRSARSANTELLTDFFADEAAEHAVQLERPLRFVVAPAVADLPPQLPLGAGAFGALLWSLKLRWWNLGIDDPAGPTPTIRLFLLYHDPALSPRVPHSAGLQKGLLGLAHLFAAEHMAGSNQVVIAHELLHTLGATDKYDFSTNQPRYPDGFAEPDRSPRYPQDFAELMGGRVPQSASESRTPESLDQVLIGPVTAAEIGWLAPR